MSSSRRVAVVGSSITGLMSAYVMGREGVEVVFYEKDGCLGGRANTVNFDGTHLDIGLQVFNRVTYANMMELFESLGVDRNETLGNFVRSGGYSDLFEKAVLIPTRASIWSCQADIMSLSAYSVLSFLNNHHALQFFDRPQCLIPKHSWQCYVSKVKKELERIGCQIRTNSDVDSVLTNDEGCVITCKNGSEEVYNACIIAAHAPDALRMLGNQVTYDESRILGAFNYAYSDIYVHQDTNLMPKNRAAWSAVNFLGTNDDKFYITYWLNAMQNIDEKGIPFLSTLNPPYEPEHTLLKWSTSHPVPSVAASKAWSELNVIQGKRRILFCGAYQGYSFHNETEDGLKASVLAAKNLLGRDITVHKNPNCMIPSWTEAGARLLVTRFLKQFITTGCLILLEEGGTIYTFDGSRKMTTLKVLLRIHTPQFYWKMAKESDLGFADAYINGDFTFVNKEKGLVNLFMLFIANTELNTVTSNKKRGWWTPFLFTSVVSSAKYFYKHMSRQNTLTQARQNISRHYDLSNELFSLFLDDTMSYSCAVFKTSDEELKTAQLRKINVLIDKARISQEHHVLEIGCGWGSLAIEVVKRTGCKFTGITLSEQQLQYAKLKVKKAGMQDIF